MFSATEEFETRTASYRNSMTRDGHSNAVDQLQMVDVSSTKVVPADSANVTLQAASTNGVEYAFPKLAYRPELDGLRAIAIIPVILFHFQLGFPGGFAGVDVFFTISGFLITSIVLYELARDKFSMTNFWERRIRRLFPALVLLLVPMFVLGWHMLLGTNYTSMLQAVWMTLVMAANIHYFNRDEGYFEAGQTAVEPLMHCWSLAAEEQFYLVHPLLLWGIWACTKSPKAILIGLVALSVGSFTLSVAYGELTATSECGGFDRAMFSYYMLPARAWEMAIGGLLAFDRGVSVFADRPIAADIVGWLGIAAIVTSCFVFDETRPWPSYRALLPCVGTLMFIASQRPRRTTAGIVFAYPAVVFVGQMSYSWYLWHWPIYVFMSYTSYNGDLSTAKKWLGVFVSIVPAVISFKGVEPVFRSKTKVPIKTFAPLVVVVWVVLMAYSVAVWKAEVGGIGRPISGPSPPFFTGQLLDADGSGAATCWSSEPAQAVDHSTLDTKTLLSSRGWSTMKSVGSNSTCEADDGGSGPEPWIEPEGLRTSPKIVLIGSSVATVYGDLLGRLAREYNTSVGYLCRNAVSAVQGIPEDVAQAGFALHSAQPAAIGGHLHPDIYPLFMHHPDWDAVQLAYLEKWQPEVVVWADDWGNLNEIEGNVLNRTIQASLEQISAQAGRVVVLGGLQKVLIDGREDATQFVFDLKKEILNAGKSPNFEFLGNYREFSKKQRLRVEGIVKTKIAAMHPPTVQYVAIEHLFERECVDNPQEVCVEVVDARTGLLSWSDQVHLNEEGVSLFEGLFRVNVFGEPPCE